MAGAELEAGVDWDHPPAGIWHRDDGRELVVGATHRSLPAAIGALAFALFWNGIVSVFVLIAIAATLGHLNVPVPDWFPAPEMNDSPMGVGMTIFLWVFLTPFIVVGLVMIGAFFSALAGRTEVCVSDSQGVVLTGIGPLGWRRRFDVHSVKDVRIDDHHWRDSDGDRHSKTRIVIETREGKQIKFGTLLSEERRRFVAAVLRNALLR